MLLNADNLLEKGQNEERVRLQFLAKSMYIGHFFR